MPLLPRGVYALCDDGFRPEWSPVEKARALLSGGVKVLQLRIKHQAARQAVAWAKSVVQLCRQAGAVCLINDRVDWALLSGADGVHVGDHDLAPGDARPLLGPKGLLGVTTRSLEGAMKARRAGADYVGLGPIFETSTKDVLAPVLGLDVLVDIAARSPVPVIAIGGIRLDNIADVAATGVHGAAVLSDLLGAPDIARRARLLAAAFEEGRGRRSVKVR